MPSHQRERLTELEYEDYYSEALRILLCKYDSVGAPYRKENGERICSVETLLADDLTVFLLAFGNDVAHEIESGKPVHIRSHGKDGGPYARGGSRLSYISGSASRPSSQNQMG